MNIKSSSLVLVTSLSRILILLILLIFSTQLFAQEDEEELISLTGTVLHAKTQEPIPFVNISLKNLPIGINANEEGKFELNIDYQYINDTVCFSSVGFVTKEFEVKDYLKNNDMIIFLQDSTYHLDDIFVISIPAKEIVYRAIERIPKNYPVKPYMLKGFYRTSFRENNKYVRLLESALDVYDEGFNVKDGISTELIRSRKSYDYRKYKWKEGANYLASFIMGDFIRNSEGNLRNLFERWDFNVTAITYQDKDEVFIIDAEIPVKNKYENYYAQLFIRIKDYAILQINYKYKWVPQYFPGIDVDSLSIKRSGVNVKTYYREYRKKMYISYQSRKAEWVIFDKAQNDSAVSRMEIHDELLVHKIDANHKKQPNEKMSEYGDIYKKVESYDKKFWRRYNKPVDTELYRAIKRDLEQEEPLEKQFRAEKMEDAITDL